MDCSSWFSHHFMLCQYEVANRTTRCLTNCHSQSINMQYRYQYHSKLCHSTFLRVSSIHKNNSSPSSFIGHSIFNLLNMVIMLAKWSTVIHTVYHGKVLFIWFFFGQLRISIWWRLHAVSSFLSSFDSSLSTVHLPPFCTSAVATKYSTLDSLSWWIIHRKSLFCILQLSFPVCRNSRCSH